MKVIRIIEKEVNCCGECPYFNNVQDMNATMPCCMAIDTTDDCYADILGDISWKNEHTTISSKCPLMNKGE